MSCDTDIGALHGPLVAADRAVLDCERAVVADSTVRRLGPARDRDRADRDRDAGADRDRSTTAADRRVTRARADQADALVDEDAAGIGSRTDRDRVASFAALSASGMLVYSQPLAQTVKVAAEAAAAPDTAAASSTAASVTSPSRLPNRSGTHRITFSFPPPFLDLRGMRRVAHTAPRTVAASSQHRPADPHRLTCRLIAR